MAEQIDVVTRIHDEHPATGGCSLPTPVRVCPPGQTTGPVRRRLVLQERHGESFDFSGDAVEDELSRGRDPGVIAVRETDTAAA